MVAFSVLKRQLLWCNLCSGDSYGGVIFSDARLWCCYLLLVDSCYLFKGDSYGGVICSEATVMVVLSVLSRQLWLCYLF